MGSYRVIVEVQLAENVPPSDIQSAVEEALTRDATHFSGAKVRSIDGEFPLGRQDDFNEWRYCLGRYTEQRDKVEGLIKHRRSGPQAI